MHHIHWDPFKDPRSNMTPSASSPGCGLGRMLCLLGMLLSILQQLGHLSAVGVDPSELCVRTHGLIPAPQLLRCQAFTIPALQRGAYDE